MILFSFSQQVNAQDSWWKEKKYKTEAKRQKFAKCKQVFTSIAEGVKYSNIFYITPYFGSEVYLNILKNESGYYSPEQARYIIENFLVNNPVNSFKWKLSNRTENYAFATGKYKYNKNGFVSSYGISVSLKYEVDTWLIDQIIVN